jgi:hypothetical protein
MKILHFGYCFYLILAVYLILHLNKPEEDMLCSDCRHYKKDLEELGFGSCENEEVTGRFMLGYAEYFLISDDFGCRFAERENITLKQRRL